MQLSGTVEVQLPSRVMTACEEGPPSKKRAASKTTVETWKRQLDREYDTAVWLRYDVSSGDVVLRLKCSICTEFRDRLSGMKNFRAAFIEGSTNVRKSCVQDHAKSQMHEKAMTYSAGKSHTPI